MRMVTRMVRTNTKIIFMQLGIINCQIVEVWMSLLHETLHYAFTIEGSATRKNRETGF